MRKTTKKKSPPATLSPVERFFIEGNFENWSPEQLAGELGKPVELINETIAEIVKGRRTDLYEAFDRPSHGVVALTEAASSRADDLKGSAGIITQAHIQRAVDAGDYDLAARLKSQMDSQQKNAHLEQCAKLSNSCHFIVPPEEYHESLHRRR